MIRGVLLDLAGVVYEGGAPLPGAADAIARLRAAGLPLRFLTNTTRTPRAAIVRRLGEMGFAIEAGEVFTPVAAARAWLAAHDATPHLLVHDDLASEFAGEEGRPGRAVVIGDAGEGFTYRRLNAAFRELAHGADLLALARNRTFRDGDGELSLDAGGFVAALEYASGTEAVVLGKPAPGFFAAALASMDCPPDAAAMVGDDAEADVAGALAAGLGAGLLVRTGKFRPGDETRFTPHPTATVADLAAAAGWILARTPG